MNFTTFEQQLLVASYLLAERSHDDRVRAGDAVETFGLEYRPGWINKAVEGFVASGLSGDARTTASEPDQEIWLTAAGYRRAEELLPYIKLRERVRPSPAETDAPGTIPASDRIVAIDHNNPQISKALNDTKQLSMALRETNDVGNMSPEAVSIAIDEVDHLAAALERPAVRMPAFGEQAKSTLTWIGREAAGALVGAAALALLALLASIFGIGL